MTTHRYVANADVFEIDVTPIAATDAGPLRRLYAAHIARVQGDERIPISHEDGRREVYGPTEAWAVANARAMIDSGVWCEAASSRSGRRA